MNTPLVSIVIVNYKDYTHLESCLISLSKTSYPRFEIIVVDNESDVTFLEKLKVRFKNVRFFFQTENLNYAEGNNYGISQSIGEFIVLLNNDTTVEENWLEPLVKEGINNPRAFYQPVILFSDRRDTINSIGNTVHLFGFAFPLGIGKSLSQLSDSSQEKIEVFYCSGACVFTSRKILDTLGGLDSNYWTYYEDVNLGWKGRLSGHSCYLVPASKIYHTWGGTYGRDVTPEKVYLFERGRLSSILRNFSLKTILLFIPSLLILDIVMLILLLPKKGMALAKARATLDTVRNLSRIKQERKKIQESRTTTDRDLSRYMSTTIEHPYIGKMPRTAENLLVFISKMLMNMI
jgi:GT2 family glycosyltransferase